MSNPMTWEFSGRNADGSPLTSKQVEALVALDEWDLFDREWECGEYPYLTTFESDTLGDHRRIESALEEWAKLYPDAELFVKYMYGVAWNPDGFLVKGGQVHEITGHLIFTDDETGEEVEAF